MNYENDIKINEKDLDIEWLEQPTLMYKYAKMSIDYRKLMDKQMEKVNVIKAGIDKNIRANPEDFEIIKITETVVANTIIVQSEYTDAYNIYLEKKYDFDLVNAAVKALQDKKSALENLVKLHGQQYFAGPSVPRDLSKEWEIKEKEKSVNKNIKITNSKRTK